MKQEWRRLVPVFLLLASTVACEEAQLDDFKKEAQEAMEEAKIKAKELGQLSEEEIQKIWSVEYKSIRIENTDLPTLDEKLNELGQERWECYHVAEDGQERILFLRRRASTAFRYLGDLLRLGALVF
jgi:hypothetical protein